MSALENGDDAIDTATGGEEGVVPADANADHIVLSLQDLLPDANGEIVVQAQQGHLHLSLMTDQRIAEIGVAVSHMTADGFNVDGLSFYAFEGGMKLYYTSDVEITIASLPG
ncbi:MAG: hypothetical protein AB7F08_05010 [Dongiaceae bacterium]